AGDEHERRTLDARRQVPGQRGLEAGSRHDAVLQPEQQDQAEVDRQCRDETRARAAGVDRHRDAEPADEADEVEEGAEERGVGEHAVGQDRQSGHRADLLGSHGSRGAPGAASATEAQGGARTGHAALGKPRNGARPPPRRGETASPRRSRGSPGNARTGRQKSMSMSSWPWPPPPFFFSGTTETRASVVRSSVATDAAFCSAVEVTFAGSITPASIRSWYS